MVFTPHSVCRFLLLCLCLSGWPSLSVAWNSQVIGGTCAQNKDKKCSATIGNAGGAGACCDPLSPKLSNCTRDNPCQGGKAYRWFAQDLPVAWFFNPNGMPGKAGFAKQNETKLVTALKAAWDAWSSPNCTSFRHKYAGKSTIIPQRTGSSDGKLVIYLPTPATWVQMGTHPSVLAFTLPSADRKTGRLNDADIFFNPGPLQNSNSMLLWGTQPVQSQELDFTEVAAHEIGHALGLAHTEFRNALMYFSVRQGGIGPVFQRNGLSIDDKNAVCQLYPRQGPCTKDSDCGGCLRCQNQRCVPRQIQPVRNLCRPCKSPSDCGGAQDICVRLPEGNRCAQACDNNECCPQGYRCDKVGVSKMCVPLSGQCPVVTCGQNEDCGPGEECSQGKCRPRLVAKAPTACRTCNTHQDCGSNNKCIEFGCNISRCTQRCAADNFCPDGFVCQSTTEGRYCMPIDGLCPCTKDSECDNGLRCIKGRCQRPQGGTYCDVCTDQVSCRNDHQCFQTSGYRSCLQPCGNNASLPAGAPGSACDKDGSCSASNENLSCQTRTNGSTICLQPCHFHKDCDQGGRCYRLSEDKSQQGICMCRNAGECQSGQICNTSLLSRIGACVTPPAAAKCGANFSCQDTSGVQVCLPGKGGQGPGQTCNTRLRCLSGLLCLRTSEQNDDGVCFEDCRSATTCVYGGRCVSINNDVRICLCKESDKNCAAGRRCRQLTSQVGVCESALASCGDGVCESNKQENCLSCAADCACGQGQLCDKGSCINQTSGTNDPSVDPTLPCPTEEQLLQCDEQIARCAPVCGKRGCGCQAGGDPSLHPLWLLLALLFLFRVGVRARKVT